MDQMEDKIGAILNNPQMMQQIMTMAQSLGQSGTPPQAREPAAPQPPELDPALLQKLSGLASQGSIDREQQALLTALNPYLSRRKLDKLERAMRASRLARIASGFLSQSGTSFLTGR